MPYKSFTQDHSNNNFRIIEHFLAPLSKNEKLMKEFDILKNSFDKDT